MSYKIFVINMAGSAERWNLVKFQLDALNLAYERIEGVDAFKMKLKNGGYIARNLSANFRFTNLSRHREVLGGDALSRNTAKTLLDNLIPFGITADTNVHLYYKYKITVKSLFHPVAFHRNKIPTKRKCDEIMHVRNFHLFARQVFQLKSYIGKLRYFLLRDGLASFFASNSKIEVCFPICD